jgi:hypothetical protein
MTLNPRGILSPELLTVGGWNFFDKFCLLLLAGTDYKGSIRKPHFHEHERANTVGFSALACTVVGRDQTHYPFHFIQLRECISIGFVRYNCHYSNEIEDCEVAFLRHLPPLL